MGVIALSEIWGFESIIEFCKKKVLDVTEDPILVVTVAKRFQFKDLLAKSYETLSTRNEPISIIEARRLGLDSTAEIARVREARQRAVSCAQFLVGTDTRICPFCKKHTSVKQIDTSALPSPMFMLVARECLDVCKYVYFNRESDVSAYVRLCVLEEIEQVCPK